MKPSVIIALNHQLITGLGKPIAIAFVDLTQRISDEGHAKHSALMVLCANITYADFCDGGIA